MGPDEPLDRVEHLLHMPGRPRHRGETQFRTLPLILETDLSRGHPETDFAGLDQVLDDCSLGLERGAVGDVELYGQGAYVHPPIVGLLSTTWQRAWVRLDPPENTADLALYGATSAALAASTLWGTRPSDGVNPTLGRV